MSKLLNGWKCYSIITTSNCPQQLTFKLGRSLSSNKINWLLKSFQQCAGAPTDTAKARTYTLTKSSFSLCLFWFFWCSKHSPITHNPICLFLFCLFVCLFLQNCFMGIIVFFSGFCWVDWDRGNSRSLHHLKTIFHHSAHLENVREETKQHFSKNKKRGKSLPVVCGK